MRSYLSSATFCLLFATAAMAMDGDALTPSDFQYLGTLGYTVDKAPLRCGVVGQDRAKLHDLIAGTKSSGKAKDDEVKSLVEIAAADHAYEQIHNSDGADPPPENDGCVKEYNVSPP